MYNLTPVAFVHFGSTHMVLIISPYFVCKHYNTIVLIDYPTQSKHKKKKSDFLTTFSLHNTNGEKRFHKKNIVRYTVNNKPTFKIM